MKVFIFVCIFLWVGASNVGGKPCPVDTSPDFWKGPEIPQLLKKSKVRFLRSMRTYLQSCGRKIEFDGSVFLVELEGGLSAVFKKYPEDDLGDAYAEVAAYEVSVVLGFPDIPPTVMTEINGMKGSLQLFVETPLDPLTPGVYETALENASPEDVANLKLFYFIFGQWDSGPHNLLIVKEKERTRLIAIDNSGIRNHQNVRYGELPFVRVAYSDTLNTDDWNQPFPFDQAKKITDPTPQKLKATFGRYFPESFYASFRSYGTPFRYVLYRNSLWRQFHAEKQEFVLSFTEYLSDTTRKKLEKLNLTLLKKIFAEAFSDKNNDWLTPEYLKAILGRRDQVLNYFKKKTSLKKKAAP